MVSTDYTFVSYLSPLCLRSRFSTPTSRPRFGILRERQRDGRQLRYVSPPPFPPTCISARGAPSTRAPCPPSSLPLYSPSLPIPGVGRWACPAAPAHVARRRSKDLLLTLCDGSPELMGASGGDPDPPMAPGCSPASVMSPSPSPSTTAAPALHPLHPPPLPRAPYRLSPSSSSLHPHW